MDEDSSGETAWDLFKRVSAAGFGVSATQLSRWHREGLLPRPRQRSMGRGKGTQSVYPAGTCSQLLALCKIRNQTRLLGRVGWHLWWKGFPVDKRHWAPALEQAAHVWDATVSGMSEAFDGDD